MGSFPDVDNCMTCMALLTGGMLKNGGLALEVAFGRSSNCFLFFCFVFFITIHIPNSVRFGTHLLHRSSAAYYYVMMDHIPRTMMDANNLCLWNCM